MRGKKLADAQKKELKKVWRDSKARTLVTKETLDPIDCTTNFEAL